jgi:hypothetical protein
MKYLNCCKKSTRPINAALDQSKFCFVILLPHEAGKHECFVAMLPHEAEQHFAFSSIPAVPSEFLACMSLGLLWGERPRTACRLAARFSLRAGALSAAGFFSSNISDAFRSSPLFFHPPAVSDVTAWIRNLTVVHTIDNPLQDAPLRGSFNPLCPLC